MAPAETQVGVHHLLYAETVEQSDVSFLSDDLPESNCPFLHPCQCTAGKIRPSRLDVCAYEAQTVTDRLKVALVLVHRQSQLVAQECLHQRYGVEQESLVVTDDHPVIDEPLVAVVAPIETTDDELVEEREQEVGKELCGEVSYRLTLALVTGEQ